MLKINDGHLFRTIEVWFNDIDMVKIRNPRFKFMNIYEKPNISQYDKRTTLVNDLDVSPDQIQAQFTKECRYEIRRAYKENFVNVTLDGKISKNNIIEFIESYKKFNILKKFSNKKVNVIQKKLFKYSQQGCLAITKVINDGLPLVHHVYIYDGVVARLLYSISLHNSKEENSRFIGFANRWLHYSDMIYFKNKGLSKYDWGGVSSDTNLRGITKFKSEFGGKVQDTYYFVVNEFWLKKIYSKARDFFANIRSLKKNEN